MVHSNSKIRSPLITSKEASLVDKSGLELMLEAAAEAKKIHRYQKMNKINVYFVYIKFTHIIPQSSFVFF